MAQQVIRQHNPANPGSPNKLKSMEIKSNTKGVPETPVMVTPQIAKTDGGAHSSNQDLPNHGKNVGTH